MIESTNDCTICLKAIDFRGGQPLCSLGCCGKFFHQSCMDELNSRGNTNCPNCRTIYTNPLIVAPIPPPSLPTRFRFSSIFGFGSTSTSSIPGFASSLQSEDLIKHHQNIVQSIPNTNLPHVLITTTPEYPQISIEQRKDFYVQVNLKYEENEVLNNSKSAIDLVCVLDVSGSMTGTKIKSLIHAMCFVVDSLGPKDRLSVISFENHSKQIHHLLRMTAENKESSKQSIRALVAGGGTDIYRGMKQGYNILEDRRTKNPTSTIFLLTDGQDREFTKEKLELACRMKSNGTSLFVFGFGNDHDSAHMSEIANAAEGNFTFIESDTMVTDAFGGVIGTMQGVSLQEITLQLKLTEHNVILKQITAGQYNTSIFDDGRTGNVTFKNMFIGENRDILLKLDIPSVSNDIDAYELFKTWVIYRVSGMESNAAQTSTAINCCVNRLDVKPDDPSLLVGRDVEVGIQLSRKACIQAINDALTQADEGRLERALSILDQAIADLRTIYAHTLGHTASRAIEQDLLDAQSRVRNRDSYRSGGRAMMQEAMSGHAYQRSCYNKAGKINTYQTKSSNSIQQRAFASKGGFF